VIVKKQVYLDSKVHGVEKLRVQAIQKEKKKSPVAAPQPSILHTDALEVGLISH
jgi:hypothetical protein